MTWNARHVITTADALVACYDKKEYAYHEERGVYGSVTIGAVTICLTMRKGEPVVSLNWSGCGEQSLERTKAFMAAMTYAQDITYEVERIFKERKEV